MAELNQTGRLTIGNIIALIGAIGGLIGGIAAFMAAYNNGTANTTKIKVPQLINLPEELAKTTLENNKLLPGVTNYRVDDSKSVGIVLEQSIPPGISVEEKTNINIVVSKENKVIIVPNIEGLPFEVIETTLKNNHLKIGKITEQQSSKNSGIILVQDPAGGVKVSEHTAINLIISSELKKRIVPNLVGMSIDKARSTLSQLGLSTGKIEKKKSGVVAQNTILSQFPSPGSSLKSGGFVNFFVAKSFNPELIAFYKFNNQADDSSGISNEFSLKNTKFISNTLYLNGKYEHEKADEKGYRAVGQLNKFNYSNFTLTLDFFAKDFTPKQDTIIVGGTSYRWFSVRWNKGNLELTLNNQRMTFPYDVKIEKQKWNNIILSFDLNQKTIITMLNGLQIKTITLPNDFHLDIIGSQAKNRDKNITFTNYSSGKVFYGNVANLRVYGSSMNLSRMRKLYQEVSQETPSVIF